MLIHADSFFQSTWFTLISIKTTVLERSCMTCDWLILLALSEDNTSVPTCIHTYHKGTLYHNISSFESFPQLLHSYHTLLVNLGVGCSFRSIDTLEVCKLLCRNIQKVKKDTSCIRFWCFIYQHSLSYCKIGGIQQNLTVLTKSKNHVNMTGFNHLFV